MAVKRNTVAKERERRPAPAPVIRRENAAAAESLIYGRLRLGILGALAVNQSATFNELRDHLETTDGNLSVHARKLEEAGLIACEKGFEGRKPKSTFRITNAGRKALDRYLDHMEALIKATRG